MDLGTGAGQQGLGMDEWVHFMLLRATAQVCVVIKVYYGLVWYIILGLYRAYIGIMEKKMETTI